MKITTVENEPIKYHVKPLAATRIPGYTISAVGLPFSSFFSTNIYDGCGLIMSMIFSMMASQQFCFDLYSCHAAEGLSAKALARGVRGGGCA